MAHHKSAKKRIRQTATKTEINRSRMSRIRTFVKKVEVAIAGGNAADAQAALKNAQPEIAPDIPDYGRSARYGSCLR